MKVLIVGEGTAALAVVRELGRSGWTVGVGSSRRFDLAPTSRWCVRHHHVPYPLRGLDPFIEGINAAAKAEGYGIVFGANDAEVLAISSNRHVISPQFPYGPAEDVLRGFDKLSLSNLALKVGIPSPKTKPASTEALDDVDWPLVVKSRLHWTPGVSNFRGRFDVYFATDRQSAARYATLMRDLGAAPLFQSFVPGRTMVLTILIDQQGSIVSSMAQLATHAGASFAGPNCRAVTICIDRDLERRCQHLLSEIRWFGLSCLQFQLTNDGVPFLIDFNGRMVGDSAFASICGMHGHDMWARLATGRPLGNHDAKPVRVGCRYHAIDGDLARVVLGSQGVSQLLSEMVQLFRYSRAAVHPVLSRDDVLPVVYCLALLLHRAVRKLIRKFVRWK